MNPADSNVIKEHPTGATAAGAAIFFVLWNKFSGDALDFSGEEVALISGSLTVLVSAFTPRFRKN